MDQDEARVRAPLRVPRDLVYSTFADDAIIRTDGPTIIRSHHEDDLKAAAEQARRLELELE